jgi:hypothetical protein
VGREKTLVGEKAEWKKPRLECRAEWVRLRLVCISTACSGNGVRACWDCMVEIALGRALAWACT